MRKGAAAVELALILPLFLLLLMGAINFGRILMVRHQVQNAVFTAARAVAVNDCRQENPADQIISRQRAKDLAKSSIISSCALVGVVPTVVFVGTTRPDGTVDTAVTVTIPYNQFSLWPTNFNYIETCQFRSETLY